MRVPVIFSLHPQKVLRTGFKTRQGRNVRVLHDERTRPCDKVRMKCGGGHGEHTAFARWMLRAENTVSAFA